MRIKKIAFVFAALCLSSCFSSIPNDVKDIKGGTVNVKYPQVYKEVLPNGLTIIYNHNEELPLVSGSLYLPSGFSAGNCGLSGLNSIAINQIREGGTKTLTPDALDLFLDSKAAEIEVLQVEDYTAFSFNSLSEDFDEVFEVFSEVVFKPRFDESRFKLAKKLSEEEISRRKDDPENMASMAFAMISYGEGSIWYDPITIKSLEKINKSNLVDYHKSLLSPDGAFLVISGNLNKENFLTSVNKFFTDWKSPKSTCFVSPGKEIFKEAAKDGRPTIYLLPRDFKQSTIIMGHHAPSLPEVDVYSMVLFNRIFGSGSFDSLLFKEIRDKRALAYGVSGGISSTKKRGLFNVSLATRPNGVVEAINGVEDVLSSVKKEGFTEEQISNAIRSSMQTFVFKFEDSFFAASRPALLSLSGFPEDYDLSYIDQISMIDKQKLKNFEKFIRDSKVMTSVVVGNVSMNDLKSNLDSKYKFCELDFADVPSIKKCD